MTADAIDSEAFRALLATRRDELLAMQGTRDDAARTVELDQTRTGRLSRMDALQDQAMARAGQARVEQELRRIEAALARLERGEYGYCVECGEAVASGRLRADPAATLCIACAGRLD